jgi:hypothetical protein
MIALDRIEIPLSVAPVSAVIDAQDYERELTCEFKGGFVWTGRICDLKWKAAVKQHTTYAVNLYRGRELRLHRVVSCAKAGQIVDHIDRHGLHCWSLNLRIASFAENARNRAGQPNRRSQFKGVSFHRATGKWSAEIRFERVKRHLGLFADEESAARAYDAKAIELFGEFAALNFPLTTT